MSKSFTLFSFLLLNTAIVAFAKDATIANKLNNLNTNQRLELIKLTQVMSHDRKVETNVLDYLNNNCLNFKYTRNEKNEIQRPTVECTYKPRDFKNQFHGMTAKFDCEFTDKDGNAKTLKVKYDSLKQAGGGSKEIPQAVIADTLSQYMGLYSNIACPVNLICKNCPSDDPWQKKPSSNRNSTTYGRSMDYPSIGSKIKFNNVIVINKIKGYDIAESKYTKSDDQQGISVNNELAKYFSADASTQAQQKIDREALALWINFLRHSDADPHNNNIICKDKDEDLKAQNYQCKKVVGYVNDFGDSIGFVGETSKLSLDKFRQTSLVAKNGKLIAQGAASDASGYVISEAGRDLFVKQLESVTDEQLLDILSIAQIEAVSGQSKESWLKAIRQKTEEIKRLSVK